MKRKYSKEFSVFGRFEAKDHRTARKIAKFLNTLLKHTRVRIRRGRIVVAKAQCVEDGLVILEFNRAYNSAIQNKTPLC